MNLSLRIKPSDVGQYYEKQCDKFLVYKSVGEENYKKLGWVGISEFKKNAAAQAGDDWENILLERLIEDDTCEVINLKKNPDYKVTLDDTVKVLKSLDNKKKTVYLYQACFGTTASFEEKYLSKLNVGDIKVSLSKMMFPDFIKAEYKREDDKFLLTVIDAKNASLLKIGAEIQIALYVKILKEIIKDYGINNCYVNEDEAIVWNREKITDNCLEHVFKLQDALKEIDDLFDNKLSEICKTLASSRTGSQIQKKLDYRISQKCEYCDNFATCKNHCIDEGNVRLMPYMSIEAQNRLKELIENGSLEDDTIESVGELLDSNPDLLTQDCSFWKNAKNNWNAYENGLKSFYDGKMERFPKNGTSISFPVNQNFSLILTAQQDVTSGRNYAYAWLLKPGRGFDIWNLGFNEKGFVSIYESSEVSPGKGKYYDSVIAKEPTEKEFDMVDKVFVESIYELLRRISEFHLQDKRKLQCYVMDDYERDNIENALYNMLENRDSIEEQDLIEKVMAILFWLQGERMVTDSSQQAEEIVENPLSVLTTEISKLYVLSEGVAYNLKETAGIFSPKFNFDNDNSFYFGTLTNVVEGSFVLSAWKDKDKASKKRRLESIASHLRKRLFVEDAIICEIQKDASTKVNIINLSAWPAQYYLQKPKYPNYPEIARLDFENRYEQLLSYHAIRIARVAGVQNAIDNGSILWLEYTGEDDKFRILNNENYIGKEWFTAWLCEDTPENRTQVMLLRDVEYTKRKSAYYQKVFNVKDTAFYPMDSESDYNYEDDGKDAFVHFECKQGAGFIPVKGKKYLFFEVYSDSNGVKTEVGLANLVDRQSLLEPKKYSCKTDVKWNEAVEKECSKYWLIDNYEFSHSQKQAFIHLMEQNLTVLVGPPASGKTDFIARALITITNFYKAKKKRNFKILVTANSHSAIENVLLKLDKMLGYGNVGNIKLFKTTKFDDPKAFEGKSVELLLDGEVLNKLGFDEIQIYGMTSWSVYKEFHKNGQSCCFDMIVMDEASQVRAMDAFLDLECSDKMTRFLLVGDDDQLPPIIAGKYKEIEGEKYIHGSVFHMFLTGLGLEHSDIVKLSDNFRMNGVLCKYPSKKLYGPEYKAYNDKIKYQKISLKKKSVDELMCYLLDDEYPLVFCELSGIAREQTGAEVELVTKLIEELWNNQLNKDTGNLASDDGNFWRDITKDDGTFLEGACGIISPHHEHINRLKTNVSSKLGLNRKDIFIGTVDKLQGKERKAVIVSYGVSESEKIKSESEFIFSSNRLNVSMTRGKAKTIIFLSDAIAEPNLTTNIMTANDTALRKGINFIHGFSEYMKKPEDGETLKHKEFEYVIGDITLNVWKKKLAEQ